MKAVLLDSWKMSLLRRCCHSVSLGRRLRSISQHLEQPRPQVSTNKTAKRPSEGIPRAGPSFDDPMKSTLAKL